MSTDIKWPKIRPEQSVGFLFWQTTNLWQRKMTEKLAPLKLTHVQFVLLANIAWLNKEQSEPVSQTMLSEQAKTDIMMTSKVVRTLELKEFITRQVHRSDLRARSLEITENGAKVLSEAFGVVGKVDREFFEELGENKQLFKNCLHKILQVAEAHKKN